MQNRWRPNVRSRPTLGMCFHRSALDKVSLAALHSCFGTDPPEAWFPSDFHDRSRVVRKRHLKWQCGEPAKPTTAQMAASFVFLWRQISAAPNG